MKDFLEVSWDETADSAPADRVPTWKRMLDIGCVLFALPAVIPLGLIIGSWIKISSPGPVFFRQIRVGLRGKRFTCLKFRSMRTGADSRVHQDYLKQLMRSNAPMTKMDDKGDSRLIPLGSFLRSTGLDELPQLINVVRGEMSLVGPRPCLPYEYESYLDWQKRRFLTLPGLTGLWQVSGKNRTTFTEMIRLDVAYVENQSLGLDIKIILATLPALFEQVAETRRKRSSDAPEDAAVPSSKPV